MDVDRQRIAAVRTLETLGYTYPGGEWLAPAGAAAASLPLTAEADAMPASASACRINAPCGCTEGSEEQAELKTIVDLIEAYEARRWPLAEEPGGTG